MAGRKLLLTGATGFLGWNLARILSAGGDRVTGTRHRIDRRDARVEAWIPLDLESPESARSVALRGYDAVIHCAAIARAEAVAADPALARRVNVEGTRILAGAAAAAGTPFIFISTDLVFDGTRAPYREDDPPSPASHYGETKAAAEAAVRECCPGHYILRTALMFGAASAGPGSFLSWIISDLRSGRPVRLYENQFRSVLYAPDVASVLSALARTAAPPGTYHLGGPERLSRLTWE